MKINFRLTILIGLVFTTLAIASDSQVATAMDARSFNAGRIIDDSVFTNTNSMSITEIQAFLDSKMPNCDTNGTERAGGGSSSMTNRQWIEQRYGISPPYRCVRDYRENPDTGANNYGTANSPAGSLSSAELILKYSKMYNINPQTLIVTLQKENGLITDNIPVPKNYSEAMGFGCPDNRPPGAPACDPAYGSFSTQLYQAARHFRGYMDRPAGWYVPYTVGLNTILWNPNGGCGTSDVHIENVATAALYSYTPYRPNQAALNAQYGTGDGCSAYGNRNFFLYFNDWFGSTIGPNYAWQIESYTYAGGDASIAAGETETITLKARNIGRNKWYNHGSNVVRLATWEPADRVSKLFQSNRLATLSESVVNVGEVGTFTLTITPQNTGTYIEGLNLVAENAMFMPWTGLRPTINVVSAYNWSMQSINYENGTGVMSPGSKQLVTLIAKNTGSATWSKSSGPQIKLATWQPDRQSAVSATWLSKTRVSYMNETTVAPGQTAGFQFYVTMPPSGGYHYEKLNIVAEGQQWLNDQDLTLYLYGKTYSWQPLWHSHSTGTANIPRNTDFTVTLKAKNNGEMPWYNNGSFPMNLGTSRPLNRDSALYSSSWINTARPTKLVESTVMPGQEGTFIIPLKTPSSAGQWNERFNPVAEGLIWLNDPGFSVYVNVL